MPQVIEQSLFLFAKLFEVKSHLARVSRGLLFVVRVPGCLRPVHVRLAEELCGDAWERGNP